MKQCMNNFMNFMNNIFADDQKLELYYFLGWSCCGFMYVYDVTFGDNVGIISTAHEPTFRSTLYSRIY